MTILLSKMTQEFQFCPFFVKILFSLPCYVRIDCFLVGWVSHNVVGSFFFGRSSSLSLFRYIFCFGEGKTDPYYYYVRESIRVYYYYNNYYRINE